MRLNSLYIVAFGAALASVEAAPLRVLTVGSQDVSRGLRYGHAVPLPARDVAQVQGRSTPNRPCFMRKMAKEAIKISNTFRKAVGLPLIETPLMESTIPITKPGKGPAYSILPFIGTPPTFVEIKDNGRDSLVVYTKGGDPVKVFGPDGLPLDFATELLGGQPDHPDHPGHPDHHPHPPHHPQHGHHGHHPHHGHKHHPFRLCRHSPFLRRLTFALMSLGKWEGRAVAFVLGCGLGVLLRMLWVLSVLTYRALNGYRREEVEYTVIHEYVDVQDTHVPPPTYTYADEKVEAKKKDEETPVIADAPIA